MSYSPRSGADQTAPPRDTSNRLTGVNDFCKYKSRSFLRPYDKLYSNDENWRTLIF